MERYNMERCFCSPNTSQHHFWVQHCTIRRLASERQQCCRASKSIRNRTKLSCTFTIHVHAKPKSEESSVKTNPVLTHQQNVKIISFRTFPFFCFNLSWQPWLIPTMWNTLPSAWSLKLATIVQALKIILKCDIRILNDRVQTSPSFKKDKPLVRTMYSTQVKSNTATTASGAFFLNAKARTHGCEGRDVTIVVV